jgi:glycogen operon protein
VLAETGVLTLNQLLQRAKIQWHGVALDRPDWSESSHSLAFTLRSLRGRFLLHGMLNAYWEPLRFELPPVPVETQEHWRRCIDTALDSPHDIYFSENAPVVKETTYVVRERSVVLLSLALEVDGESVSRGR